METYKALLNYTKRVHPKIIQNAKEVDIYNADIEHKINKDTESLVFKCTASALTEGKTVQWDIEVELFPSEKKLNVYKLPSLASECFVSCSCPYFLYFCEYALTKVGSSFKKYSNGKPPRVRNPSQVPIICKHLVAASEQVLPAIQKWAKTKVKKPITFV